MTTSVGFNTAACCAAMRARIRNVQETNLWDAATGEYVAAGRVPLPQWWIGTGKLAELVAPAIHECLVAARPLSAGDIPLLLCAASQERTHRLPNLDGEILGEIAYRLEAPLHPSSVVIPRDQASIIVAIATAGAIFARGEADACIIAGVDTFIDQPVVEHYLSRRRILTSANSNGFSPGEAGSAVLVGRTGWEDSAELRLLGVGATFEPATIESDEPLMGDGLTAAVGAALAAAGLTIADVQYRISDLNGEHYKFKEMVLSMLRFERRPRTQLFDLWHPIEYIGEVGAAIGPLVLGVALQAARKGYGPGPTVLCTFGNDSGERGAIVAGYRGAR